MKYKGTLIAVKDCKKALKFYQDMFGFELLQDNDGNMELSGNLYLQETKLWEKFIGKGVLPRNNCAELYFEEPDIDTFVQKLQKLYPETEFVNLPVTHSWVCGCPADTSADGRSTDRAVRKEQRVVRFYDIDGNLIEVGTPM